MITEEYIYEELFWKYVFFRKSPNIELSSECLAYVSMRKTFSLKEKAVLFWKNLKKSHVLFYL